VIFLNLNIFSKYYSLIFHSRQNLFIDSLWGEFFQKVEKLIRISGIWEALFIKAIWNFKKLQFIDIFYEKQKIRLMNLSYFH